MSVEQDVKVRYAEGAQEKQVELCCPVDYQSELLALLPEEIIEKDYGCGDPSRYVKEGDVVLDLGSGGGKICYMAAQIVGDKGHVYGVDMTDDMLALARKYQGQMADKIGGDRVTFHKGYIQDLAFNVSDAEKYLSETNVDSVQALADFEAWKAEQRDSSPMIEDGVVSLVISNCVLNLVGQQDRSQMLSEIFRVLQPGGRVAISDIVSDTFVPENLQKDPVLWSGCISGAFQEHEFLQAFEGAGFTNVAYDKWAEAPWQVVEGIEFRSVTLTATKPAATRCGEPQKAIIYVGPMASVTDDFGNVFVKGKRTMVRESQVENIMMSSMAEHFVLTEGSAVSDCGSPSQATSCC